MTRRGDSIGRIPGQHLIDGSGVIEESLRRVAHGPYQGALVHLLRQLGHGLAEPDTRNLGLDGLELASDIRGRIRFGIPDIDVTGPSLKKQHDNRLGRSEALHADQIDGRCRLRFFPGKEVRQAQAEQSYRTDTQELSPRRAVAQITSTTRND